MNETAPKPRCWSELYRTVSCLFQLNIVIDSGGPILNSYVFTLVHIICSVRIIDSPWRNILEQKWRCFNFRSITYVHLVYCWSVRHYFNTYELTYVSKFVMTNIWANLVAIHTKTPIMSNFGKAKNLAWSSKKFQIKIKKNENQDSLETTSSQARQYILAKCTFCSVLTLFGMVWVPEGFWFSNNSEIFTIFRLDFRFYSHGGFSEYEENW